MFNYYFMFYVLPENTSIKMSCHSFQVKMHAAFTLGIYSISLGKVIMSNYNTFAHTFLC